MSNETTERVEIIKALEPYLAIWDEAEEVRPLARYIVDLRIAAADEAEKACIQAMCLACKSSDMPVWKGRREWIHAGLNALCPAADIYDMRRKRNEGSA